MPRPPRKVSGTLRYLIPYAFVFFLLASASLCAEETPSTFDYSDWEQFLKKYVNEKGEVNYRAAKEDPSLLDAYLGKIKSLTMKELSQWSREEYMALLINAFNAGVIRTVLDYYPVKNIMNIPGGWEQAKVQIGRPLKRSSPTGSASFTHSLNEIESTLLRKTYRDEKILFVLSRAAKGSPRLRREAYTGSKLEGQLYLATREFVNDEARNRIQPGEKKIVLSRIFKWYARDFLLNWGNFPEDIKWGPEEMAVLSFFAHYLEDPPKVEFLKNAKYKVKYDPFDWRLNDWA